MYSNHAVLQNDVRCPLVRLSHCLPCPSYGASAHPSLSICLSVRVCCCSVEPVAISDRH